MRRYIVTPPGTEPLTLAEAKSWLRVDHGEDDGLIQSLIRAARERVEARTGRAIMAQSWRIVLDRWPAEGRVALPILPVMAVTAVRILDPAAVASVVAPGLYAIEPGSEPPCLVVNGAPQPGRGRNGIEIDIVAGYGAASADCPAPLRQAMRLMIIAAYDARGPDRVAERRPDIVSEVERLIAPYRLLKFGRSALEAA